MDITLRRFHRAPKAFTESSSIITDHALPAPRPLVLNLSLTRQPRFSSNPTRILSLFNDHWVPSPLFCRLVDSLFFHVDEECGPESLRSSGQLEFSKVLTVQSLIAGEAEVSKLPVRLFRVWIVTTCLRDAHRSTRSGRLFTARYGTTTAPAILSQR